MQTVPWPQRPWPQDGLDALFEAIVIEVNDFRETQRRAVALAAILKWANQLASAPHDAAAGPRRRQIDKNRITPVRRPGATQFGRRPQMKRVGVGTAAILHGREHPPAAVMLKQRRIARDHAGDKGRLLNPAVREAFGPIQIDGSRAATLRHHPHFAAMLEHERIGQM